LILIKLSSNMGGKQSRPDGSLLEGSAWLRSVVQHYQKRRQGVSGFDSFLIEPLGVDVAGVEHYKVNVAFRNSKGKAQTVYWVVKAAVLAPGLEAQETLHPVDSMSVGLLNHEIRVYTEVFGEIGKFLANKKNSRARYLLNVPDLVFHERLQQGSKPVRCHLVTEDVAETKRCSPVAKQVLEAGLSLGQFKVLLGTLAQFHAVGIAWSLGTKDDSMLDLFPFLHTKEDVKVRNAHLATYSRLLEAFYEPDSRERRLFGELLANSDELLKDSIKQDMCDPLGGLCLGPVMANEVMFQYETTFFDLCGVGGASNVIWKKDEDDIMASPICAAITTCGKIRFGNYLKELAVYFFSLPEALVRERYIVFMLQSYCHVLTMTLEMLDVDWQKHFGSLTFIKMVVAFYEHIPQALLRAVVEHMTLTDPAELEALIMTRTPTPAVIEKETTTASSYIPLTSKRVQFLLSLVNLVHKPV